MPPPPLLLRPPEQDHRFLPLDSPFFSPCSDVSFSRPLEIATLVSLTRPHVLSLHMGDAVAYAWKAETFKSLGLMAEFTTVVLPAKSQRLSQHSSAMDLSETVQSAADRDVHASPRIRPTLPSRFSIASTSTASFDLDAIPDYRFNDDESDIFTVDMSRDHATSATNDERNPFSWRNTGSSDMSSAELGQKAEMILASAKKRLQLMDENLKGARALTAQSLRSSSFYTHRPSQSHNSITSNDSASIYSVVSQQRNETPPPDPKRVSRLGALSAFSERVPRDEYWTRRSLRGSKSQELPVLNSQRPKHKRDSSASTIELKAHMESLNKRVSLLREMTKEDGLRRSVQSLDQASPFTNARQYHRSTTRTQDEGNRTVHTEFTRPTYNAPRSIDWSPVSPIHPKTPTTQSIAELLPAKSSQDSPVRTDFSAAPAHEDREDAFDYQHVFLHSTLGRMVPVHDGTSEASDDTAKVPDIGGITPPSGEKTTGGLLRVERGLLRRLSSSDDSNASFATAMETTTRSRLPSPSKKGFVSGNADPGMAWANRASEGTRPASKDVAAQVRGIAAPPTVIALAAMTAGGSREIGLKDKATLHTLLEGVRAACERLQQAGLDEMEAGHVRRRLEAATRAMI